MEQVEAANWHHQERAPELRVEAPEKEWKFLLLEGTSKWEFIKELDSGASLREN